MIRFRLIEGYYGARVEALYILCSETVHCSPSFFSFFLIVKRKNKRPESFFTLANLFFFFLNSFRCIFLYTQTEISNPFISCLKHFTFLLSLFYLSTLNWTGIMLMSVEYYTPKRIIPCFTKRHGRSLEIPDEKNS